MQISEPDWTKVTVAAFTMMFTGVALCVFFYFYMLQN